MMELIDAGGNSEDMWSPYKELVALLGQTLASDKGERDSAGGALDAALRTHRHTFLNILTNPPKNNKSREEIKAGATEGVNVPGCGHTVLPQQLVDETLIISDMYSLNEYLALGLLCTAQRQMPRHPGLPRGLVAVLLYYDGKKALAQALKMLFTARKGVSWQLDGSSNVVEYVTSYSEKLVEDGIIQHILEALESWDLTQEIEMLQRNRALGGPRHRRQVLRLMREIQSSLASSIASYAAQAGLPRAAALSVVQALRNRNPSVDEKGAIDDVTVSLMMAYLYSVDLSVVHRREDGEELAQILPVMSDPDFLPSIGHELNVNRNLGQQSQQSATSPHNVGLQAVAILGWALAAANTNAVEGHDQAADIAINMKVFEFLHETFLSNKSIYQQEFYAKRMHTLYTDFIVLMHSKLTELRLKADEAARTAQQHLLEGLEPPSGLPRHLEALLLGISVLYKDDPSNLKLQYWTTQENNPAYRGSVRYVSLYKFIRSGGELSPARVLSPWARAVASLAAGPGAASRAYHMLNTTQHLSFQHFFSSLHKYYSKLVCQEGGSVMRRAVRSDEIVAIRAALHLISAITRHDPAARQTVCHQPNWTAVSVMIGLVGCSIPIPLKADLVMTLGSLGTSPETALIIWNSIETAQLINTVPSTSNYLPCGVETELEEVEARNEEFPLTRALLQLFDTLSTSGIPRTLGAGPRKPGFDPYLTYIVNSVFLKFPTRSYKNLEEKWEVASLCLKLFEKFLNQYEANAADFPQSYQQNEMNPLPGFHIMLQMNMKSDFMRLVLAILDEGVLLLDTFQPFPGKEFLEAAALSCLNILERTLLTQPTFMSELNASGSTLLVTGLNKLLLGVNPRTQKPDHVLNICKFVTYNSWLQKHALSAVNVLTMVAIQPVASQHLISILACDATTTTEIRHGFVECLEAEEDNACDDATRSAIVQTKEATVHLLQSCLNGPPPNIAHYLLGFHLCKDVSKTAFHQPGVMNFPRTCLHSVISILDASILPESDVKPSALIEGSYKLLYLLCSKQSTAGSVLRYLRACNEFIARHAAGLRTPSLVDDPINLLSAAWLLKLCAVELHVTACERQSSHFTVLAKQLVESLDKVDGGGCLLRVLPCLGTPPTPPTEPLWRLLEGGALAQARKTCMVTPPATQGPSTVNIPALRALLAGALTGATQNRARLTTELEDALSYAVALNRHSKQCWSLVRLCEGWCLAAEAVSLAGRRPAAAGPLLRGLLSSLNPAPPPPLQDNISGTVLILLVSLRQSFVAERRQALLSTSLLDKTCIMNSSVAPQNILNLQFILQRILHWLMQSGSTSQKMRVNLYGAVLNFLRIANGKYTNEEGGFPVDLEATYVSRLDATLGKITNKSDQVTPVRRAVLDAVSECGSALMECIGSDATGASHEVCRVAALACLQELVGAGVHPWEDKNGHVHTLVDSLYKDDEPLKEVLEMVPKTMKALFVYESKMSLLLKIAASRRGAESLLQQGLLSCLSNMQVFDCHPDIQSSMYRDSRDFIPSVASRYRQILVPALALCDALITTLGSENHSCLLQIIQFLLSHSETVESVLRAGGPLVPIGLLMELEALTCVIARSSNQEIFGTVESGTALQESVVSVYRIQKLMLALFPRFALSDSLLREMSENSNNSSMLTNDTQPEKSINRVTLYFKVMSNLTSFVRNITANHGVDHGSIGAVFRPVLNTGGLDKRGQWAAQSTDSSPHLGVLIQQLVNSVVHFNRETISLELVMRKLSSIPDMNTLELDELLANNEMKELSVNENRLLACEKLSARLKDKRAELDHCRFVIDNSLYLIWAHLDFYMLRAIPVPGNILQVNATPNKSAVISIREASFQSSAQDISDLKHSLASVFNDTFTMQLVQTSADQPNAHRCFLEALLRKIKCLLQFVPVD